MSDDAIVRECEYGGDGSTDMTCGDGHLAQGTQRTQGLTAETKRTHSLQALKVTQF